MPPTWNKGMFAALNSVIAAKCAIIIHFRSSINMGISNLLFNGVKMLILKERYSFIHFAVKSEFCQYPNIPFPQNPLFSPRRRPPACKASGSEGSRSPTALPALFSKR